MRDHIHELHLVEVGRNQALGRARVTLALQIEILDLLREWQIRGFKLLETRAKNRFTQEVYSISTDSIDS